LRRGFVSVCLTFCVVDVRTCHTPPFAPQLATTKMSDDPFEKGNQLVSKGGGFTIDFTLMAMPPVLAQLPIAGAGF
jgi:hypothetical protein